MKYQPESGPVTSGPLPGGYLASSWASSQDGGQIPRVTTTGEQGGIFTYLTLEVFSNVSPLHIRWPKYWSFSFSIIPSKEIPGLISFRMDCLEILAVQGTLKSLRQHHSSKASILQCSAFFTVQLSHPYMTTGKTIALTRQTFVGKVTSLLFNMLPRLVITFLPRSKRLSISWLQSPSTVILEPKKIV